MADIHCSGCTHFFDTGHSIGTCRRYPHFQNRSPNEVCGEFMRKEVKTIELPVYDIMTDTITPKKRGRKPKNAEAVI
jgi:hypothetical protein